MPIMKKLFLVCFVVLQTGCAFMLSYIRDKQPSLHETREAQEANEYMWEQFHLGNYDSIPSILEKLNDAYETDPNNVKVTAHLGFVYLWTFSERVRQDLKVRMLENVFLSNRFFKEAMILNPKDPRLDGFQAAVQLCEGALTNNREMLATSYFSGLKAIKKWPQFNRFALGYVESQLDTGSKIYKQGLRYQWHILNECSEMKLTKEKILECPNELLTRLFNTINNSTNPKIKRACGNTWIAPHNWEGFFLNLGDMLVKAGELNDAKIIYNAAKYAPSFNQWVYKNVIDKRIAEMNENKEAFNRHQNLIHLSYMPQMMINSEMSCMGCHEMSKQEFAQAGYQEPRMEIYFLSDAHKHSLINN